MGDTITCPTCNGSGRVPDPKAKGREMAARRKQARVTLREVAAHMGFSVGYVSDLEHGRKKWRGGLVIAYMDAVDAAIN